MEQNSVVSAEQSNRGFLGKFKQLNFLDQEESQLDDTSAFEGIGELGRTVQNSAEQCRTGQNRAEQGRAKQSRADRS
ncbi:hypothetical protein M0802_014556 [Mischocyttarus mexicanus]|nr:hypothetical protein M0802_014556 [Mischocyttarus mexicanus]